MHVIFFVIRAVLEDSSDGPLSVGNSVCCRNACQYIPCGFCLQECQICPQAQVRDKSCIKEVIKDSNYKISLILIRLF